MFVEISKGHIINTDKIISLSDETKQVKKKVVSYFDNTYSYEYTTSEVFEVFLAEGFKYEISKEAYNKLVEMLNYQTVIR